MRKAITVGLITAGFLFPHSVSANEGDCWIKDELLGARDCQVLADSAWEGLSMNDQQVINSVGLTGTAKDKLVIDFRQSQLDATGREGAYRSEIQNTDGAWEVNLYQNNPIPTLPRTD